jgi:hypothetical protein
MRDLTNEPNIFKIRDGVSGEVKEFIYRTPTAMEHQAYAAKSLGLRGNKAVISRKGIADARVEFGLKILIGIKDDQFGVGGKPISSDPQSPDYREDWKELLKQYAPDLISLFAVDVFDGTKAISDSNIQIEFEEDAEEVVPFGTSSAPSGTDAPRS